MSFWIPNRILMRITQFKATHFRQLEKKTQSVAWELYLPPQADIQFSITAKHSRLFHTAAIESCLEKGIAARLDACQNQADAKRSGGGDRQRLFVRVVDDRFTVSLDTSGTLLFKRGLKEKVGQAPLRETLASAVLTLAGYSGAEPLMDPMCGSGTFSLEAAMIAQSIPPGFYREFAFMKWPAYHANNWAYIKNRTAAKIAPIKTPSIFASDDDPQRCRILDDLSRRYGFSSIIKVFTHNFFELLPLKQTPQTGLVVLNPPYGRRLGPDREKDQYYLEIMNKLRNDFKGWRAAILVPDLKVVGKLPTHWRRHSLFHGGLNLNLLVGVV